MEEAEARMPPWDTCNKWSKALVTTAGVTPFPRNTHSQVLRTSTTTQKDSRWTEKSIYQAWTPSAWVNSTRSIFSKELTGKYNTKISSRCPGQKRISMRTGKQTREEKRLFLPFLSFSAFVTQLQFLKWFHKVPIYLMQNAWDKEQYSNIN